MQIYDGFLGRGNERREERRGEEGVLGGGGGEEGSGEREREEGGTVAKIKSQETSFDICPFCSGIARPDRLLRTRGTSGVFASAAISSEPVYNRGGGDGGGACFASALRGEKGLKEYFYGRQKRGDGGCAKEGISRPCPHGGMPAQRQAGMGRGG